MAQALTDKQREILKRVQERRSKRDRLLYEAEQRRPVPQTLAEGAERFVKNIPGSAQKFGESVGQMVTDIPGTVENIGRMVLGTPRALIKNMPEFAKPELATQVYDQLNQDPHAEENTQAAEGAGKFLLDRFGGVDNIIRTLVNDPVGFASDLSALLGNVAGPVAEAAGMNRAARVARAGEAVTNPVNAVTQPVKVGGVAAREGLGVTTGAGGASIAEAVESGMQGGQRGRVFREEMRAQRPEMEVVREAEQAIDHARTQRRQEYEAGMQRMGANRQRLNFQPVAQAFQRLWYDSHHGPHQKISDQAMTTLRDVHAVLNEWYQNPSAHTVAGFDALKQRISQMMPNGPDPGFTGAIVTRMTQAVRGEITRQAPEYADIMRRYENDSEAINNASRELSITRNATPDQTLRKLSSIMRSDANTNYGARARHEAYLAEHGAGDIRPAISGKMLRSWAPRGLARAAGAVVTGGLPAMALQLMNGGLDIGTALATGAGVTAGAASSSPRIVGEIAHKIGQLRSHLPNERQLNLAIALQRAQAGGQLAGGHKTE